MTQDRTGKRGGCGGKTDGKDGRLMRYIDANIDLQLHLREEGSIAAATSGIWGFGSASEFSSSRSPPRLITWEKNHGLRFNLRCRKIVRGLTHESRGII